MANLKICIVCHPSQGGSGILASELGSVLARRGHDIHFVTHTPPFRLSGDEENITLHRVDVTDYPLFGFPPYSIALAGKLATLCRAEHFDVLHVHYTIPHAISAYLCQSILHGEGRPVVTTLHGTDVTVVGTEHELNEVTAFVLNSSSRLTTVSEFLRHAARIVYHIDREIRVLPNFVDTMRFRPALRSAERRRQFAPGGEKLIGHMSNFRMVKRVFDVLKTFQRVRAETGARLVLVGDGAQLPEVRAWIDDAELNEHAVVMGAQKNVENIVAQLDVFMLHSQTESFGLAALEAMACGIPIVATQTGGPPEVVRDGIDGMLVPIGDIERMTTAVLGILGDVERHAAMGASARAHAVAEFDAKLVVDRYEALYRELC